MPLLPTTKNPVSILKGFRNEIVTKTGITNFDRDSKARAILDPLTREHLDYQEQLVAAFDANFLSSARGDDLDRLGVALQEPRRQITFADSDSSELNVAFVVETGTFGDINGAASISITAGTVVKSVPNNNELGREIEYTVTEAATLAAGSSVGFVSVRAVVSGTGSNVGAGVLTQHDFTSYVDAANNSLKVVNYYPILNGRDRETDDQYRARLANKYNSLISNNETKIKLTAVQVPGVVGIKTISGYFGIGTVGVIVLGAENQSSPALVEAVQFRLNQMQGPGLTCTAVPATEVSIDIELELKPTRTLSETEKRRIRNEVKRIAALYFAGLSIGETVSLDSLATQIKTACAGLATIPLTQSRVALFKSVYLRKSFSNSALSERALVIKKTVSMDEDEYGALGSLDITFVE